MKKLIERIAGLDFDGWMLLIVMSTAVFGICLLIALCTADHKVRCYYLQTEMTNSGLAYKIMNDIDWATDTIAYASNDGDKTLKVISTMKQCQE